MLARVYPVLDAIALEVTYAARSAEGEAYTPHLVLSQLSAPTGGVVDAVALAEELARALQEWAWGERGI